MTFAAGVVTRSGVTNTTSSTDATITGDGSTPIDAADIVGGLSTKTVTFAPGETTKNVSWEIVGDSAVEPDEGYKITLSNPSSPGGTYSTPVGRGTIMNDDNTAPGNVTVYGPTTTGDTTRVDVGSVRQRIEHPYVNGRVAGTYMFGLDASGNGYALNQKSDNQYDIRKVTAYSVGDPLASGDPSMLGNTGMGMNFANGDILAVELRDNKLFFFKNEVGISVAANGYTLPTTVTGTGARYLKHAGSTVTDLKIIRLA